MGEHYKLEGTEVVAVPDVLDWAQWFQTADRTVAKTTLADGSEVSTVFLGLDHGWRGPPLLFETMIFAGPHDQATWRYSTWDEAKAGHDRVVAAYPELPED